MSEGKIGGGPKTMGVAVGTAIQKDDKKKKEVVEKKVVEKKEKVKKSFYKTFLPEKRRVVKAREDILKMVIRNLSLTSVKYKKDNEKEGRKKRVIDLNNSFLSHLANIIPKDKKESFNKLKRFFQSNKSHLLKLYGVNTPVKSVLDKSDEGKFKKSNDQINFKKNLEEEYLNFIEELPEKLEELQEYYYKYELEYKLQKRKHKIDNDKIVKFYSGILGVLSPKEHKEFFQIVDQAKKKDLNSDLADHRDSLLVLLAKSDLSIFSEKESSKLINLIEELKDGNNDHSRGVVYENLISLFSKYVKSEKRKPKEKKAKEVKVVKENIQKPVQEKKGQKKKEKSPVQKAKTKYNNKINSLKGKRKKIFENNSDENFSVDAENAYLKEAYKEIDNQKTDFIEKRKNKIKITEEHLAGIKDYLEKKSAFEKEIDALGKEAERMKVKFSVRNKRSALEQTLNATMFNNVNENREDKLIRMENFIEARRFFLVKKLKTVINPTEEHIVKMNESAFSKYNGYITDLLTKNHFELIKILGKKDLKEGTEMLTDLILQRNELIVNISDAEYRIQKELKNKKGSYKEEIKRLEDSILRMKKTLVPRNKHLKSLIDLV